MSNLTHGKRKRRAESPARRFSILKKSERPGVFWGCYRALWRSIGEAKKPVIIEITGFFGAGNVTRTHDLLIRGFCSGFAYPQIAENRGDTPPKTAVLRCLRG